MSTANRESAISVLRGLAQAAGTQAAKVKARFHQHDGAAHPRRLRRRRHAPGGAAEHTHVGADDLGAQRCGRQHNQGQQPEPAGGDHAINLQDDPAAGKTEASPVVS